MADVIVNLVDNFRFLIIVVDGTKNWNRFSLPTDHMQ